MERPAWIKDKKVADDFEVIRHKFDGYKDFKLDKGYVLIKVYHDTHEFGLAVCADDHTILKEFRGRRAQDLYTAIFEYSEKDNKNWFKRLDHAAYLGKELQKAYIALQQDLNYVQDDELDM